MVRKEHKRYQKKMLKIWESWDPNGNNEKELEWFIKDHHPAAIDIKRRVNQYIQQILHGVSLLNKEKRHEYIEGIVKRSWEYEDQNGAEYCRKVCDEDVLRNLYGIHVGGSDLLYLKDDDADESGIVKGYYGNSSFFMTPEDLEKEWDKVWEWNRDEEFYGSDELKDWMWNQQFFGIKSDLFPNIATAQELIPNELKEEIEQKLKEINEVYIPLKSEWEVFEKSRDEGGKNYDLSRAELKEKGLYPEPVRYRYFAEEFWKDFEPKKVIEKFEKEKKEKRYKKDLGNAILDVDDGCAYVFFKDNIATQLEGFETLENMKNGTFLGGQELCIYGEDDKYDDDATGYLFFTPEWGDCKEITKLEDYIIHICKKRKIKEGFFWARGIKPTNYFVGYILEPDELYRSGEEEYYDSEEHLLEVKPEPKVRDTNRLHLLDTHRYFHLKNGSVKEIFDKDLPTKGLLNGNDEDLSHAYAATKGEKEWKFDGMEWDEESYHRFRHPYDFPDIEAKEKSSEKIEKLTKDSKKLTLIWEGNLFHNVHLISPEKFWKRANIPEDVFRDFWRIVVEPDEQLMKKTQRKDSMDFEGTIKIIDGEKEHISKSGIQKIVAGHSYAYFSDTSYYKLAYKSEIANLDYAILHGVVIEKCHFKLEIEGGYEHDKLTYDEKTATVLYDGKEFEIMPYCLEKKKWINLTNFQYGEIKNEKGDAYAFRKGKSLSITKYNAFMDEDDNELVPNYSYNETIFPKTRKYKKLLREDTVEREIETRRNWNTGDIDPVNDPNSSGTFDGWID